MCPERTAEWPPQATTDSTPIAERPEPDGHSWDYTIKPYLWAAGLQGEMQVGALPPVDVDLGFGDIIEDLDFTLMFGFEARKPDRDWALMLDVMFVRLEEKGEISEVEVGQTMIEAGVSYRPGEQDVFELIGGLRYWRTNLDVDILTVDTASGEESWVDPILGGRAFLDLAGDWSLLLRGDLGGFGVGSQFSYQARASVRYAFSDRGHLEFGYRHLYFDYDEDEFRYDAALSGPLFGLTWKF